MSRLTHSRSGRYLAVAAAVAMLAFSAAPVAAAKAKNQAPRDQQHYEQWLTREVRHRLVMLPFLTLFDNIEYRVDGTKVTLTGYVIRPVLRDDAGRTVKGIEGVTGVDNQIKVLPPSPMDDGIRRREYRAIYGFADLWKYAMGALPPIHIVVDSGHVTLYGVVDSEADKNLVGLRAKTVPDVFSVDNNLQVASQGGQ